MKARQLWFIILLFSILIFVCACSQKQTKIQPNINIKKLTWNTNVEKYEANAIQYLYKRSQMENMRGLLRCKFRRITSRIS